MGTTLDGKPSWSRRGPTRVIVAAAATAILTAGLVVTAMEPAAAAVIDTSAYYQLVARHSGKAVTVEGASTADGATVAQRTPGSGAEQQFQFVDSGPGFYRLRARHSGKVLDVTAAATTDGAAVIQWPDVNTANQQFQVVDTTDGFVKIVNRNSGKALDINARATTDGATLVQWTDNGATNQQFQLARVGSTPGPADPTPPPTDPPLPPVSGRQVEDLNRGVVSVRSGSGNLVSWRLLGTEVMSTGFNVYRNGIRVNASPITNSTNLSDSGAAANASYTVRAVVNGTEQAPSETSLTLGSGFLDVPISSPGSGYVANDASVGDLDGDGQYEIVLKWDPSNARDNSQAGVTGNVFLDAYRLNGTRLWRIDLGRNIRAGAHYTQFQVYDYSGDGRAEVAVKTADGTRDGRGTVIGNANADHRNSGGYVLAGPEFLTMFDGLSGAALSTVNYDPPRGNVGSWGDTYGNRVDRFLAGTAYLDGRMPSLIMARGYYTRAVVAAWDFRNGSLVRRWTYDSGTSNTGAYGQGNHNLSVADVDADGRDEIVYGSATIDDNGGLLWRNGSGHGDALHVGDFIPSRAGLEIFKPTESGNTPTHLMMDARTGQTIWSNPACGCDNGRGVAADIHPGSPGAEAWSVTQPNLRNGANGANVGAKPSSANFLVWWDGDTSRELLDRTMVDKYNNGSQTRLLTGAGVTSINGTKATPAVSGDIFGDWREEIIWPTSNNSALRIYSTPNLTTTKLYTLMHETQYRVAIAWQNTAYNQPPHPRYHIGNGMSTPARPNVYVR